MGSCCSKNSAGGEYRRPSRLFLQTDLPPGNEWSKGEAAGHRDEIDEHHAEASEGLGDLLPPSSRKKPSWSRKAAMMRQRMTPSYREKLVKLHSRARRRVRNGPGGAVGTGAADDGGADDGEEGRTTTLVAEEEGSLRLPEDSTRPAALAARTEAARLRNIFAAPLDMDADFVAPVSPKSAEDAAFVSEALEGNFVFSNLGESETKMLVDAFEKFEVAKGTELIVQGEVGDYFYVIRTGSVAFVVDGAEVGTASEGGSFGELALLYDCPRAATCIASSDCVLWRVDQNTFRKILASTSIKNDNEVRDILKKVPFLKDLDDKFLNRISDALTTLVYEPNERIIRKGDEGNVFYVIKSGRVKISDIEIGQSKYGDQVLGLGGYFGERAIVTKEKRVANVTALDKETTLLCLSGDDFNRVLGDLGNLMMKSLDKRKLI